MRIRFSDFLVTVLIFCASSSQANAGVRVAMADDLDKNQNFLVTTDIYYHKPEGFHVEKIDESFLTAGRTKDVSVLAVWPLLYHHVAASAIHPAYYTGSSKSDKTPFALRTVELPLLRPRSWRHLLDSGEQPEGECCGPIAAFVCRHFNVILESYLPAFDRDRIQEDLRQYLPLLRELVAFAHREEVYKERAVTGKPGQGPVPRQEQGEVQSAVLNHYGMEMDQRLNEITSWLGLEQSKRAAMHDWMDHFHKADYVYRVMMKDLDHKRIEQWLEERRVFSDEPKTLQWTNAETGLHYTLYLQSSYSGQLGSGWRTVLTVDLNSILGLKSNERYLRESFPCFYRNAQGMWKLE